MLCLQRVEDRRRSGHPGGVRHQRVLCGGVCDGPQQHRPLCLLFPALHRLPQLHLLPGETSLPFRQRLCVCARVRARACVCEREV